MTRSTVVAEEVAAYAAAHSSAPDPVQRALVEATRAEAPDAAGMQIGTDQGAFLSILTAVLRPRFAVEVGTFTGYSSLAVARALPPGGRLLCCDVSEEWTAVARRHWALAGVDDRVELRLGPALDTLRALPADPPVDLAFVDADKTGYLDYYEELLGRLSDTGVILVDNTLWSGAVVVDPPAGGETDASTAALRAFNDHVAADPRVEVALLTVGDGVTMIRRR